MNKPLLNLSFCIALVVISMSSCQQKMYFPDRANSPGLTQALDAKATISIKPQINDSSIQNGSVGNSVDLAFSPINHFGIIGSYRWINDRVIKEDQEVFLHSETMGGRFNGKRWELGVGVYEAINERAYGEVYIGYGNGSLSRFGTVNPQYNYDTRYHRFFLQPALGFKVGNYFTFSGGFKTVLLTYYDFQSFNPDLRYQIGNYRQDITDPVYIFVEPFFNFEGGYKYIKGSVQVGSTSQINNAKIAGNFPLYISIGITFHFSRAFLKSGQ